MSFSTSPSFNVSTLQQRIKVIKEKNNILNIKCNTPRLLDSNEKVFEKLLQEGTECGLLNEEEISTVENCFAKAIKLVECYKKAKKKRLSFKSENIGRNQNSENLQSMNERKLFMKDSFSQKNKCLLKNNTNVALSCSEKDEVISVSNEIECYKKVKKKRLSFESENINRNQNSENLQSTNKKKLFMKNSFTPQNKCLLKNKTNFSLSFSEKDEVISVSDEDNNLSCCSKSFGRNKGLRNIQYASEQNKFKDSQENKLNHLKNKGSKSILQHCNVKDADVIVISDEDNCLPSSDSTLVKENHQIKNLQLSCEENSLLKDSLNLKEKGRIKKDEEKVLNNNSSLQAKRYNLGCFSKRNKLKRKANFQDKFKRKEATLILNQKSIKQFNKNIQNSDNDTLKTYKSDNKVFTISDEIYNNGLDISNQAFDFIEKKSLTNFEYEILENDIAGNQNFQNNSEKLNITQEPLEFIVPELNLNKRPSQLVSEIDMTKQIIGVEVQEVDLTKETTGVKVQEVDLTEDIGKDEVREVDLTDEHDEVMSSDLDLTKQSIEVIIPDLDFTEEPVDFIVPRLHLDEIVRQISDDKIKSLKLEGVTVKTGRWDTGETELLKRNFRAFQSRFGVIDARLLLGIGRRLPFFKDDFQRIKKFLKVKHFNVRLGKDINERTLYAIYKKARWIFNPLKTAKNCKASDISSIIKLQKKYGNNWNLVGQKLGIQSQICSNLFGRFVRPCSKGSWSNSEINNLIFAVQHVVKSPDLRTVNTATVSWEKVAELVSTRDRAQCCRKFKEIIKKRAVKV